MVKTGGCNPEGESSTPGGSLVRDSLVGSDRTTARHSEAGGSIPAGGTGFTQPVGYGRADSAVLQAPIGCGAVG